MFFRALDYIRRKPKAVREQYALGLTMVVVGSIAVVWLMVLPGRFGEIGLGDASSVGTRPFSQFFEQFRSAPAVSTEQSVENASAATTTPVAVSPPPATLELSPETLQQIASSTATTASSTVRPQPRAVRIATSSSATTSSSD